MYIVIFNSYCIEYIVNRRPLHSPPGFLHHRFLFTRYVSIFLEDIHILIKLSYIAGWLTFICEIDILLRTCH